MLEIGQPMHAFDKRLVNSINENSNSQTNSNQSKQSQSKVTQVTETQNKLYIEYDGLSSEYGFVFGNSMLIKERVNTSVEAYKKGRIKK